MALDCTLLDIAEVGSEKLLYFRIQGSFLRRICSGTTELVQEFVLLQAWGSTIISAKYLVMCTSVFRPQFVSVIGNKKNRPTNFLRQKY